MCLLLVRFLPGTLYGCKIEQEMIILNVYVMLLPHVRYIKYNLL
jgi:hypothetical protein